MKRMTNRAVLEADGTDVLATTSDVTVARQLTPPSLMWGALFRMGVNMWSDIPVAGGQGFVDD